jgi:transcriptional regulator with XRE-family HTH domain
MTFYEWLKQRRKALDYTQRELADLAGCSPETLRKIEAGVLRPSRQLAGLLSGHLELTPEQQTLFAQAAREPHQQIPAELYALLSETDASGKAKPPLQAERARITNLPAAPTALIGREVEIAAICERLMRGGVR